MRFLNSSKSSRTPPSFCWYACVHTMSRQVTFLYGAEHLGKNPSTDSFRSSPSSLILACFMGRPRRKGCSSELSLKRVWGSVFAWDDARVLRFGTETLLAGGSGSGSGGGSLATRFDRRIEVIDQILCAKGKSYWWLSKEAFHAKKCTLRALGG
jgi:hypothetical protein